MADIEIKKKLTPKDFNPKRMLADPNLKTFALGSLVGRVTGTCELTSVDDEIMIGLTGMFLYKDHDEKFAPQRSGVFWPPSGMLSDIFDMFRDHETGELKKSGETIEFGGEWSVVTAGNPAGYEWRFRPFGEPAKDDPLARLTNTYASEMAPKAPALEAPAETPVDPAPVVEEKAATAKKGMAA